MRLRHHRQQRRRTGRRRDHPPSGNRRRPSPSSAMSPIHPTAAPCSPTFWAADIQEKDLWLKAADYYQRWQFTPVLGKRVSAG